MDGTSQREAPYLPPLTNRKQKDVRVQECSEQLPPARSLVQPEMRCGLLLQLWQMRLPSGLGQGHATQLYLRALRRSPTPSPDRLEREGLYPHLPSTESVYRVHAVPVNRADCAVPDRFRWEPPSA